MIWFCSSGPQPWSSLMASYLAEVCPRQGPALSRGDAHQGGSFMQLTFKRLVALGMAVAMTGLGSLALADSPEKDITDANELLAKSRDSFNDLIKSDSPDKGIPREMLEHARAIAVFPRVLNAAIG